MQKVLRKVGVTTLAVALATVLGLVAEGQARAAQIPDDAISGQVCSDDDCSNPQIFNGVNRWSLDPKLKPKKLKLKIAGYSHTKLYIQIRFNNNVAWTLGNVDGGDFSPLGCQIGDESTFVKSLTCSKGGYDDSYPLTVLAMYVQDDVTSIDWAIGTDDFPSLPPASGGSGDSWGRDDITEVKNGVNDINKNLTDSKVDTNNMSETIGGFKIQPVGIVTTAITAVVKLPTLLTNKQACESLDLGELLGHQIKADCISTQVNPKLWATAGIISDFLTALAIFYVIVKIATSIYLAKEDPVGIAGGTRQ